MYPSGVLIEAIAPADRFDRIVRVAERMVADVRRAAQAAHEVDDAAAQEARDADEDDDGAPTGDDD
jgi:hypothetical protein